MFGHDSFKAPALNTLSRVFELRDFVERAAQSNKTRPILAVIEELRWSITMDPAANETPVRQIVTSLLDSIAAAAASNNTNAIRDAVSQVNAISLTLGDYRSALEKKLREYVPSGKEKAKIANLAASYVVQLENEGFSKRFLHYQVETVLTNRFDRRKPIVCEATLQDFFNSFSGSVRKFNVFFRASEDVVSLTLASPFEKVEVSDRPNQHRYIEDPQLPQLVLLRDVEARDPISARDKAFELVRTVSAVSKYFSHGLELQTGSKFIVKDAATGDELVVKPPVSAMLRGTEKQTKEITEKQSAELSTGMNRLSQASRRFLFNALQYHKEALDSQSLENQLVDLWAAIEGFVPQPSDDRPRLNHYLDSILPTLGLVYPEKIFGYLGNALFHSSADIRNKISSLNVSGSFAVKSTALILCPEFKTECDEVCGLLDSHPLLRYRMFRSYEAFSSPERISKTLVSHNKKLEWHLSRVYNTRNTIMHSATALPYLETLVENLHSYVDILLSTTVHIAANSARGTSIKSILNLTREYEKFHREMLASSMRDGTTIKADNFASLVFGSGNPICRI